MASPPGTRFARRLARVLGTVLTVIGVVALVWGFVIWRWGDPVTGLYTKWEQRQLSGQLESLEKTYAPVARKAATASKPHSASTKPMNVKALARRLRTTTTSGNALGRIRVSRLGLNMIVVDGTDHDALIRGPGIDRRTHLPGEGELVYIAGHRTTYGAPFANIDRLGLGDEIELDMPYGTFTYRVTSHVIVPADDLARLRSRGREEIALQACHPRFSARERYIVYATPVRKSVTKTTATAAAAGKVSS